MMATPPSALLLHRFAPLSLVSGVAGLVAHQAHDIYALWAAWEAECGVRCAPPFWAVAWPAARVLARYLLTHPENVEGRCVLDLGCGGAVAAIAAARAGAARVIANDVVPAAVQVAALNAAANSVALETSCADLTAGGWPTGVEAILLADMFYEEGPARAMTTALRRAAGRGVRVLIADSGRPFSPRTGIEELHAETVAVSTAVEGVAERRVRVFDLLAGS